ncbi:MAG: hypothetical protein ACPGF7_00525 [Pontibacterium sp.]
MTKHLCRLLMLLCMPAAASLYAAEDFYIGQGGYELCKEGRHLKPFGNGCGNRRIAITEVLPRLTPNANAVSIWITRDWQEDWYDAQEIEQQFINKGYTPLFIFYWFADEISPDFIEQNRAAYFKDLQRFTRFISRIKGKKLVILNPEFNQNGAEAYEPFNDLLIQSMREVRKAGQTKASFCIGDFGNYSQIIDLNNWKDFHPSVHRAAKEADFISFQEMRAVTRNSPAQIAKTAYRSLAFATYLHETYNKPTFLAYLALSSYGKGGEAMQAHVYQGITDLMPLFREHADMIGFNSFHLIDIPDHQGYFNEAEKHFGLLDKTGNAKPALAPFLQLTR